jgi:hypothetical protein
MNKFIIYFMFGKYNLNESVILNDNLRKFLKMRNNDIKMNVLLNYVLCNYCERNRNKIEEDGTSFNESNFIIYSNFKKFLEKNNSYIGDDYSIDGIKLLLEKFVTKKIIYIKI